MAQVLGSATTQSSVPPNTQNGASASSATQPVVGSSGATTTQTTVENYQFLLPRIFDPPLTEEQIQQREREQTER